MESGGDKMMVGNLIKCKKCKRELQPEELLVGIDGKDLVTECVYCGEEISRI